MRAMPGAKQGPSRAMPRAKRDEGQAAKTIALLQFESGGLPFRSLAIFDLDDQQMGPFVRTARNARQFPSSDVAASADSAGST